MVTAPIGKHSVQAALRTAALAARRPGGFQQRDELGDVVAVAAAQRDRERSSVRVGDQMVLAARSAPVYRASSRQNRTGKTTED
ncbi:hypothetical protein GCM10009799_48780 [Nocardiopsis rhodophaea]|uniref:Uncharacterized protein n=1 Tax=Nocardiopsis rhodophaea TaxID=280238 RepID=A0ABN2TMT3_9ACTN